ncbi:MAG: glycosyltransferase family 39 protein, partial [Sandaracinaceae bacterium]|nr:glycosyltransferase family 39 protein [Sandaracinaceae bacterium]
MPAFAFTALALFYAGMYAASPMSTAVHGDGYYTYLWARSIVFDGDLDFHQDYLICPDPWGLARVPIGDDLNYWGIGGAIFWVPILAFDRVTHHSALDSPDPHQANACLAPLSDRAVTGSILAGWLTAWIAFAVARRRFGQGPALFGAIGIATLGPHLYYSAMLLSYAHAVSAFGAGLLVWLWDARRDRVDRASTWLLWGAALGLAMLIRAQNAIFVILPFASWFAHAARTAQARRYAPLARHALYGLCFTLALAVVFSPQSWYWHHVTGSWITVPQGEGYMRWGGSMWHKSLFSAQGLLPWSPIHYLAIAGLGMLAWRRETRALGVAMLVLFALESYVVGAAYDWSGSVGFPGRRFDALVVPFGLGLAAFGRLVYDRIVIRRSAPALIALGPLVLLGFFCVSVSVGVARGMRTDTARSSAEQWSDAFGQTLDPMWEAIGNPLTWPASIPFAIHYGTHPRRWDVVGAPELFHHDERTLRWREIESTIDFAMPTSALYADGRAGEEPSSSAGRAGLLFPRGSSRIFLPLHGNDAGAITLRATAVDADRGSRVSLRMRGVDLGTRRFTTPGQLERYDVPRGLVGQGIHELWVWVEESGVLIERLQILDQRRLAGALVTQKDRPLDQREVTVGDALADDHQPAGRI